MSQPMTVDIPHELGREGVRQRLDGGIGRIAEKIPGGGTVNHSWADDRMTLTVSAMGQTIQSRIDIFDSHVHAEVDLPAFLQLFAGPIRTAIETGGPKLLK